MRRVIFSLFVLIAIFVSITDAYAQNKVLSLDGDGDYVSIQDSESLRLPINQTYVV